MMLDKEIRKIVEAVRLRRPASLELEIGSMVYVRNFCPGERLILLGGGHVSQAVCSFAAAAGFYVTVVDDRPSFANRSVLPSAGEILCDDYTHAIRALGLCASDYVCVLTRGHRFDLDCLREILSGEMPHYLGMMSSRRRAADVRNVLLSEGFAEETIDKIYMPIGLPIRAVTPEEIAISITAELIFCRREGLSGKNGRKILALEDANPKLIDLLAKEDLPKALMIVYRTSGPTPVKSGAMMVVAQNTETAGTIGGGCSEGEALIRARTLIGTGKSESMTVYLDPAEKGDGMACGGSMCVWIADVGSAK